MTVSGKARKGLDEMQAITTKFLGPTNHRGSRIKATCDAGSITVGGAS